MTKHLYFMAVLAFAVVFTSCEYKNNSVGEIAEILIVVQNDDQWNGRIGDSIRAYFQANQYGLPQPEPRNSLTHIKKSKFSDLFKKYKSIIEVEIDPNLDKAVATTSENFWTDPQRYIKISAPNITTWVELFDQQKEMYQQWFDEVERERIMIWYRKNEDKALGDSIAKHMGIRLTIPNEFTLAVNKSDFMWFRSETKQSSADIVIYQIPYKDTIQFEPQCLINTRNMMMMQYIPGPTKGSYMGTETEVMPPMVTLAPDFPAGYTLEMRGMWKVENDYMAGPFVSYTFVNSHTGNLITVEGYYYEPNKEKRNNLLQLESILYSMEFVD